MSPEHNYLEINRQAWNKRTEIHVNSEFYNQEQFLKGKSSLNDIELNLLGDVTGKSILHLQCHFGQDTISLARLGATATGVDFSDKAIEQAKHIAKDTNANARFICCDVFDLPNHLNQKFDVVFTSYGTIGWLPDLNQWAGIISRFLKPNGTFVFVEFHPVVWMFDNNFEHISYRYFNSGAIEETNTGTYADKTADVVVSDVSWNHSIAEVLTSLLLNGLQITSFQEFDYTPYNCFHNTKEVEPKKFRIEHLDNKIPMVYALAAVKTG